MCKCFDGSHIEIMSTKNRQVWVGQIETVKDGNVSVKGIGIIYNEEDGHMRVTQFQYCPSCGKKWKESADE